MSDFFKTPEEAREFLRKVMGPPSRELKDKEKDHVLLMLSLKDPFKETNNQHSWTSYYMIGNKEYHVTTFPNEEEIVELILSEDEQNEM
jgi:hypothetical protein